MSGCYIPNKEMTACSCCLIKINPGLCECKCHIPIHKSVGVTDNNEFHLIRSLIKRVDSLYESRESHMKMIKEMTNKVVRLEEELMALKISNEVIWKEFNKCKECQGTGKLKVSGFDFIEEVDCDKCNGFKKERICPKCNGDGKAYEQVTRFGYCTSGRDFSTDIKMVECDQCKGTGKENLCSK